MKQTLLYFFLISFTISFAQAPEEGLVAYYPFSGNANDATSFQNDGIVDGPVLVEDRFGNPEAAYSFDGVDDIIIIPNANQLFLNENFTLSAWILPEEIKTQFILVKSSAVNGEFAAPYGISLSGTNDYIFSVRPNGDIVQARSENYPINEWISMIAVKEIDDIRIYDRALSDEEIEGVFLNLEEENLESLIQLYPNPTTDILQLSFPGNILPQNIEVFSVLGERMLTSRNTTIIDMTSLAKGVYFARIMTSKGILTKKIVKK